MAGAAAGFDHRAMAEAAALLHPATEILEAGDELVITLEVPGFRTEKLRIDLTERTVTIRIPREPRGEPRHVGGFNAFPTPC